MALQKQVRDTRRRKKSGNTPHRFVNYKMPFHVLQDKYDSQRAHCLMQFSSYFEGAVRLEWAFGISYTENTCSCIQKRT